MVSATNTTKIVILILVVFQQLVASHNVSYTALTFGKDSKSYILLQPDMNPLKEGLTICSWVRRMSDHQSVYQYWLSYVASANSLEIVVSDTARYYLFNDHTTYTAPAMTTGQWHHICATWGYTTRTKSVYYDGEEIGTETTPSGRKLNVPGSLMLGQYHGSYGGGSIYSSYYFGGELHDTNIFSTPLSAAQVKDMFTHGRCSNYSLNFSDVTFLSWRDILLKDRQGSVTEVELEECDTTHTHPEEKEETTDDQDKENIWQFLRGKNFHNRMILEETLSDMTDRLELLGEFSNHTLDDALIAHLQKHHSDGGPGNYTEEHPEEGSDEEEETDATADSLDLLNADSWKFLTTKMFYNRVVTDELLSNMTDRLELLAEFTGHLCDDALIEHLEKHHS